jgi:hypothetical protein
VVAVSSLTHSSRTSQKTGAHYGVSHCSAVDFFAAASGAGSAQLPQELVDSTGAACEPPEEEEGGEEEEGFKSLYTMLKDCKCFSVTLRLTLHLRQRKKEEKKGRISVEQA